MFPDDPFLRHDFSMKSCVLENYEDQVQDPSTTATCVATNLAFAQHKIPYTDLGDGKVVPTLKHKFFETDLPFGLVTFKDIATMLDLPTPLIDAMILWNQGLIDKEFVTGEVGGVKVDGKDVDECVVPSRYGLKLEDILS